MSKLNKLGQKIRNPHPRGQGPAPPPVYDSRKVACATCGKRRRPRAMQIYDCANDMYFCNEACEEARQDSVRTDDMFQELVESIKEADRIQRGEVEASRTFRYDDKIKETVLDMALDIMIDKEIEE